MKPALSVIIPTRNERDNISPLLAALRSALAGVEYELLFVDDSVDGTDRLLAAAAATDPAVTLIHRQQGRAARPELANAVVEGFARSRGDAVGVCDADLQHPPALLPVMLRRLEETGAEIVVAS